MHPWAVRLSSVCVIVPVSTGESSTVVSPYLPGGVSDGQWHTLQIRYYNKVPVPLLSLKHGALSPQGVSERLWLSRALTLPHGGGCGEKVDVIFCHRVGAGGGEPSGPHLEAAGICFVHYPCPHPFPAQLAGLRDVRPASPTLQQLRSAWAMLRPFPCGCVSL